MGLRHELKHILAAIPEALRREGPRPEAARLLRPSGVPLHLVDLFCLLVVRSLPIEDGGEGPRVLVLHGYAGSPGSHGLLRRHLQRRGFRTVSVDMRGHDRVQGMGDRLRDWLIEHVDPRDPIPIVAHSLGGVVTRFAMRDPEARRRIARIISLGSPHDGTRIADLVDSRKASQLERDAELTETLETQEPWNDELPPLLCFWSAVDLMMVPPAAAVAEEAMDREIAGVTHYGYLLRRRAFDAVADALSES